MTNSSNISKNLKIVFFGTSDRSEPILKSLQENFDLKLCITKTDRRIGRKQILKETGVKKWAKENSVEFFEVSNLKNENLEQILEKLDEISPDYGVVADFSFIIPEQIIDFFNQTLINIHFSMLPKYRGASPVQFAIKNGDKTTGITYQLIDLEMDKGDIIAQYEYTIPNKITSNQLYDEMFVKATEYLPQVLENFASKKLKLKKQNEKDATYTYSMSHPKSTHIYKEDAKINWQKTPQEIENMIRAYYPWPIAWTTLSEIPGINLKPHVDPNLSVKIYSADIVEGKLQIKELQVQGKNKMDWKSFSNGYLN